MTSPYVQGAMSPSWIEDYTRSVKRLLYTLQTVNFPYYREAVSRNGWTSLIRILQGQRSVSVQWRFPYYKLSEKVSVKRKKTSCYQNPAIVNVLKGFSYTSTDLELYRHERTKLYALTHRQLIQKRYHFFLVLQNEWINWCHKWFL